MHKSGTCTHRTVKQAAMTSMEKLGCYGKTEHIIGIFFTEGR